MKYGAKAFRLPIHVACLVMLAVLAMCLVASFSGELGSKIYAQQPTSSQYTQKSLSFRETLSEEERAWLKNHPVITAVQDRDWPPVEFVDDAGEPSGISRDYLTLVEERVGFEFKMIKHLDWQESYERLKRWDIDMTTCVAVTPEREKFWAFTKPYINIPIVILTRSDVTYVANISELEGKKVGVVEGYVSNEWIQRDFPNINLRQVKNVLEGINLVQNGEIFALIDNMLVINYFLAKLKLGNLKIAGWTPYVNAQAIAVRKDWPELASIIQKALESITEQETSHIYRKWVPLHYEHKFDYSFIVKLLALFGIITSGLLYWTHRLTREIASRQKIESALRESEQRYKDLWEKAPVMMASLDTNARIGMVSDLMCEHLGYERSEMLGRRPFEFQTPESANYAKSVVFPEFMRAGVIRDAPLHFQKKNGEVIDVILNVTAERDRNGAVLNSRSVFSDVTERNRAEASLLESQRMYSDLVAGIPSGVYRFRMKDSGGWNFEFVSDTWCELNGLDKEKALSDPNSAMDIIHPDERAAFTELNDRARKTLEPFTWEGRILVNGDVRYARIQSRPRLLEDGDMLWNGVQTDITDSRRAEQALRENEELLRGFFENAASLVWVKDLEGRFVKVNRYAEEVIGLPADEMMGKTVEVLFPEIDAYAYTQNDKKALLAGVPLQFEENSTLADGLHTYLSVKFPLRNSSGDIFGLGAICTDITDRKRAEMERQRLESAIEQAAEVVVITNVTGNILYVNPAFEKVTGYHRSEAIGKTPRILKSGSHDEMFYKNFWKTIKQGQVWEGRFINRTKDGKIYYEDATISPVRDPSGKIVNFVAVKRDVTEHLELSRKLNHAQKMEAVGTLAGGVAHDFNNILQVALGYTDLMLNDESLPEQYRSDLARIKDSALRGADLVQRLMTFSRKTETRPQPLDLNRRITELRKILERTIPKMIDIQLILDKNLDLINADPTQIDQILMNLSVNARDAMPTGGTLSFETANIFLNDYESQKLGGLNPGPHVTLKISDTGCGIDDHALEHIFEPFFTTKSVDKGTGLGLAIVHSIVQQHGAHIICESQPRVGTAFRIFFPSDASNVGVGDLSQEETQIGGTETIMVVDDDQMVREFCSRILRKNGYKVIEASNGEDALDIYKLRKNEIDLIILDLIMPGMGGKQCLERLIEFDSSAGIVIASGYDSKRETGIRVSDMAKGFIEKPFEMQEMLRVIREALDENS